MTAIGTPTLDVDWLKTLEERIPIFLSRLQKDGEVGRYIPCLQ